MFHDWSVSHSIHSEFLNTACRTTARTARIRNKFTKQRSTSNCFPSGCFKFWLLRCLAQTTNKSPAESDRRLTDTAIGMPQLQSTQVQRCSLQYVHHATVQWWAVQFIESFKSAKCKVLVSVSAASGYDSLGTFSFVPLPL